MVFHGGLWYALSIIGIGMTYCVVKAAIGYVPGQRDLIITEPTESIINGASRMAIGERLFF